LTGEVVAELGQLVENLVVPAAAETAAVG
jgi:hypothetical protein